MSLWALVRKVLYDWRWPIFLAALILGAYELLWSKITERIYRQFMPLVNELFALAQLTPWAIKAFEKRFIEGPAQIVHALLGGDLVNLNDPATVLTIGYVHPFVQFVLCLWGVARGAAAIAGEIDRGTMELLLAQPISRRQIVYAHLVVELLTLPILVAAMLGGTVLGVWMFALPNIVTSGYLIAACNALTLAWAVSGLTLIFSALGRSRWKVAGGMLLGLLVMFLINLFGQLWPVLEPYRPATLFFYYQPQLHILQNTWWPAIPNFSWTTCPPLVLAGVGLSGYILAAEIFHRRDIPAPL
ncbi:MAG: ABC transporter permease subunit [Gemmatales bacterium]|nr:ABC transporter permease [Gemmatales bacterium]MDW7995269.1 ABC transporter permease subunit [Gemmatales bacterium]